MSCQSIFLCSERPHVSQAHSFSGIWKLRNVIGVACHTLLTKKQAFLNTLSPILKTSEGEIKAYAFWKGLKTTRNNFSILNSIPGLTLDVIGPIMSRNRTLLLLDRGKSSLQLSNGMKRLPLILMSYQTLILLLIRKNCQNTITFNTKPSETWQRQWMSLWRI